MKKRDKMRVKCDEVFEKMINCKARRKAEGGVCMVIAMIFVLTSMQMCVPNAEAKSSSRSSSSRSKSYSRPSPKRTAPRMNLSKRTPTKKPVQKRVYKPVPKKVVKPVVKKSVKKTVVKNTTVVNKTTVINRNNGSGMSDALVTGMVVGSMMNHSPIYHSQPYHDPYSDRTIDFTCIDGMKYRLTLNGDIKPVRTWLFKHRECTGFEMEHYSQERM